MSPPEDDTPRDPPRDQGTDSGRPTASPGDNGPATNRGGPPPHNGDSASPSRWEQVWPFVVDVGSSILIVGLVGVFLFAASGVWPPLVAVESGSMSPNINKGDLIFVMEDERFPGPGANDHSGVVTARAGQEHDYKTFGNYGDVIIYVPDGDAGNTETIHRAMFWVDEGENWYEKANPDALGTADDCEDLLNCPAPHGGYVTKGDHNSLYDQAGSMAISEPVKPAWITGTAEVRIPLLGEIRLRTGGVSGAEGDLNRSSGTEENLNRSVPG